VPVVFLVLPVTVLVSCDRGISIGTRWLTHASRSASSSCRALL
jgi:hypothetical protein